MKNDIFTVQATFEEGDDNESVANVRTFLDRLGYIAPTPAAEMVVRSQFDGSLTEAVRKYQRFHGLQVTGTIDEETRRVMETPRCGVADLVNGQEVQPAAGAGYVASGGRWPNMNLTYKFVGGITDLPGEAERDIVRRALNAWAAVTSLMFTEVTGASSVEVDPTVVWP